MSTQPEIEPTAPAVGSQPGGPPPVTPRAGRRSPRLLAAALSALRGDKYMAGAYPPEWPPASTRAVPLPPDDAAAAPKR